MEGWKPAGGPGFGPGGASMGKYRPQCIHSMDGALLLGNGYAGGDHIVRGAGHDAAAGASGRLMSSR